MNRYRFVLRSRGTLNTLKRSLQILSRFGPDPERMEQRFDRFMDLLDRYSCRPTFPVTAVPMGRHPKFAHRLLSRGAELAVHAYTHVDLASLDREAQFEQIGQAVQLFRRNGVPFVGFRAPYLHWNDDTMAAVETYQFRYSSNQAVLWNVVDLNHLKPAQAIGWEKARVFYKPLDAEETVVLPFRRRSFVEIPISLPDDETLLDRMYLKDPQYLARVWDAMLEATYRRGELFTVQLHPERIDFFAEPLSNLLSSCRAKKPGVWVASLEDIASWWNARIQNRAAFIQEDGAFRAVLEACTGTTAYLRIDGAERLLEPGTIKVESLLRPCVGISPGSDRHIIQLLRDKGYILEVGEPPEGYAIHLGKVEDTGYRTMAALCDKLEAFNGPLLRFGTWPYGNRSAVAITGDIDALTIWDFLNRLRGG